MALESYTIEEVAQKLRVRPSVVYKMARKGTIRAVKAGRLWRIPAEALEEYMRGGKN
jgi:excisionase family DNA binding protein